VKRETCAGLFAYFFETTHQRARLKKGPLERLTLDSWNSQCMQLFVAIILIVFRGEEPPKMKLLNC